MRLSSGLSDEEVAKVKSALTPNVHDFQDQGWEETTDAALTFLLRTSLGIYFVPFSPNLTYWSHLVLIFPLYPYVLLGLLTYVPFCSLFCPISSGFIL